MPRAPQPPTVPDSIHRLASLREGVVTTRDLCSAGLDAPGIRSLRRAGRLFQVLRGAYSLRPDPGPRERAIAAALMCHPEAVVSHEAATTLLGWNEPWPTDVTHLWLPPGATRAQERPLVRLHWGLVLPEETQLVHGVPVTTPPRTARDLLKFRDRDSAVALLDQGLHCGSLRAEDLAEVAARLGPRALAWARLTDRRSESPLETRVRLLLHDAGLFAEPQVTVTLPSGKKVRVDLGWEQLRVGVECDSRRWHDGEEPVARDNTREGALWALGWHLVRVTWRQLRTRPQSIVDEVGQALALRRAGVA